MQASVLTFLALAVNETSHEFRYHLEPGFEIGEALRSILGGRLEMVPITDPALLVWCDEDRHPKRLPANRVGSCLVTQLGGPADTWVGTLLVTGRHHNTPTSLTDHQVTTMLEHLDHCR